MTPFEMTTSKLSPSKGSDSTSPSTNSTFVDAHLRGCRAGLCEHLWGHVDARDGPSGPTICAATSESMPAPEPRSSTRSPGSESSERERIGHAGERLGGAIRDARKQVGWIAEVERPGAPGREDEFLLGLLGDPSVRLLDLALENLDVDVYVDCHSRLLSVSSTGSASPMPGNRPSSSGSRAARTGSPVTFHALNPPIRSVARRNPSSRRDAAARLEENPSAHTRMTTLSTSQAAGLRFSHSGSTRHSRTDLGMWIEPGITPLRRRSSLERRSTISAPDT